MIPTPVIIILAVILFVGFFILIFHQLAKKLKTQEQTVREKFKDKLVYRSSAGANFAGQKSKGMAQIRGNGALVLVEDQLYFEMLMPKREIIIPIEKITNVTKVNAFLAKAKGMPLLMVEFLNNEGQADAAAWWVRNVDEWIKSINELRDKRDEKNEN
ncbi:MAG: hypothetical protein K8T10_22115 [Candidatus Eremiobacteraeota bacterium]|nr:hypothetical protein [Candidatus Eremiobacteraeota bacterium]